MHMDRIAALWPTITIVIARESMDRDSFITTLAVTVTVPVVAQVDSERATITY